MARQFRTRSASMKFTDQRAKVLLEVLGRLNISAYRKRSKMRNRLHARRQIFLLRGSFPET
jgi:hypothetical protein